MKLIPASSALWMIRIDSFSSLLPQSPNIMAPRQSGLTYMPVRPRVRCSIGETLLPGRGGDRGARSGGPAGRAIASARGGGGGGGGEPTAVDEGEAGVRVVLGDRVDGDVAVEPDGDDVV